MEIKVNKPEFSEEFNQAIHIGTSKGASVLINPIGEDVAVFVYSGTRILGKYIFSNDEDGYILKTKQIIEREYYPFEMAVYALVRYAKKRKVKFIAYN